MIRSRTTRLAATAVLGAAVLAGTAACGPMQAGAAAVVDGHRISDNDIQTRVSQIQAIDAKYGAEISKIQQAAGSGNTPSGNVAQDQVKQLIDEAVWNKAAALVGATATAQDDAALVAQLNSSASNAFQQTGLTVNASAPDRIAVLAAAFGVNLAPGGLNDYVHISALQNAVIAAEAKKLGVDPSTASQAGPLATAVEQLVTQAAGQVKTTVSPRYGSAVTLDPQTLTMNLGSLTPAWLKAGTDQQAAAAPVQG